MATLCQQLEAAQGENRRVSSANQGLQDNLSEANTELSHMRQQLEGAEGEKARLEGVNKRLNGKLEEATNGMSLLKQEHKCELLQAHAQAALVGEQLEAAQGETRRVRSANQGLQENLFEANTCIAALEANAETSSQERQRHVDVIQELRERLRTSDTQRVEAEDQLTVAAAERDRLTSVVADLDHRLQSKTSILCDTDRRLTAVTGQVSQLEAATEQLTAALSAANVANTALQVRLDDALEAQKDAHCMRSAALDTIAGLRDAFEATTAEAEAAARELATLNQSYAELQQRLLGVESVRHELSLELDACKAEGSTLRAVNVQLQEQLSEAGGEKQALEEVLAVAEASRANLEMSLDEGMMEVDSLLMELVVVTSEKENLAHRVRVLDVGLRTRIQKILDLESDAEEAAKTKDELEAVIRQLNERLEVSSTSANEPKGSVACSDVVIAELRNEIE